MSTFWHYLFFGVALYCALQARTDLKRKDYVMAAIGAALAIAIILRPVL